MDVYWIMILIGAIIIVFAKAMKLFDEEGA